MFITNPEIIKDAYICGRLKADYIKKHFFVKPFYFNNGKYYFSIKEKNLFLPWYIKILR
jgi:hypothetical protein